MRTFNLLVMRRDTQKIIDEDPTAVALYRVGKHGSDPEIVGSFTGKISGATERGFQEVSPSGMGAEQSLGRYRYVILAPWNVTGGIKGGDELRTTHTASGITKTLRVLSAQRFPHKWEAMADEYQP